MANKLNSFGANKLNVTTEMPQMEDAFDGWESELILVTTTTTVVDGERVVTENSFNFRGVKQPLNLKAISLKPEGQRSWQWYQIHCRSSQLDINVDDIITLIDGDYKIMGKWDFNRNGFVEYHCVKDFE